MLDIPVYVLLNEFARSRSLFFRYLKESYGLQNLSVTHGIDFLFHPVNVMQYKRLAPTLTNCIISKRLQGYTQG